CGAQVCPKPPPPDGIKSNPSKRHRDRLNGELDKLTSLLPFTEDVRSRLDKLSVLRLSVGYLKVKSFFNASIKNGQNGSSWNSERSIMFGKISTPLPSSSNPSSSSGSSQSTSIDGVSFSEGDLLLQALNGFVLVVTAEGYVFYTSPTIQDFLGFHQSDVIHQSVFELIHTDDRALFRRQLHFAFIPTSSDQSSVEISTNVMAYDPQTIPPENSSFLERNFCCRFRCLLDNSSGFLALNFHGRLKFIHGQNRMAEDGTLVHPQLALFAVATPMQPPSIVEIRAKTLIFQTKHKLDFTPMGIDTRGKMVLGYNEVELCMKGSGYNFIHAADMMYCADNHIKMIKTGESGFTVFRLLAKSGTWIWVQANARLVFKDGKPDFIVARQKALTNEEGEEQLHLRRLQLPFNFATGEAMLYDVTPTIEPPDPCSAPKQRKLDDSSVSPNSILGCMMNQDQSLYHNNTVGSIDDLAFKDTHATLSVPGDAWLDTTFKHMTGSLTKSEATVQDMMDSLQQILGESELTRALDVEPDELKSWESTLLKLSTCDMSDDLSDILSNDVLMYVEEQLQREGGLKVLDQLDDILPCVAPLDLQSHNHEVPGQQNFGWTGEPQNQLLPNRGQLSFQLGAPVCGTMKLIHIDPPQLCSAGLDGPTLQHIGFQQSSGLPGDACTLDQSIVEDSGLGAFALRQPPANQGHFNQMPPPTQNRHQMRTPASLQDKNPVFSSPGNHWSSNSNQVDHFVDSYADNNPSQQGFAANPSSCLQGHFALQSQNSDRHKPSWSLDQQQLHHHASDGRQHVGACLNQMPGFQRDPLHGVVTVQNAVNGASPFKNTETPNVAYAAQQNVSSGTCMFGDVAPSSPSRHMLNPSAHQMGSKSSCLYRGLPGGVAVPGMANVLNPDESTLTCKTTMALGPEDLLVQQQQYLCFSDTHTQINVHPVTGNGGFPFSSMPNGNAYYSENN
uniref:Aryl hydrocarbon receptor n=1 Tax=Takifugu rubripes TaxID=31033 RepID=H2RJ48_TAKRU